MLQSAPYCIEFIRKKIPDIVELEKSGKAPKGELVIEDRIDVCEDANQCANLLEFGLPNRNNVQR